MATPEKRRRVKMAELRKATEAADYQVVVDAGAILIVRHTVELSVYLDGRVLLKTTDKDDAQAAYDHVRPLLEQNWS